LTTVANAAPFSEIMPTSTTESSTTSKPPFPHPQ
jgi:hypothetical protein